MTNYNFETGIVERLLAMLESPNADDVPFLVAAVQYWREKALGPIAAAVI